MGLALVLLAFVWMGVLSLNEGVIYFVLGVGAEEGGHLLGRSSDGIKFFPRILRTKKLADLFVFEPQNMPVDYYKGYKEILNPFTAQKGVPVEDKEEIATIQMFGQGAFLAFILFALIPPLQNHVDSLFIVPVGGALIALLILQAVFSQEGKNWTGFYSQKLNTDIKRAFVQSLILFHKAFHQGPGPIFGLTSREIRIHVLLGLTTVALITDERSMVLVGLGLLFLATEFQQEIGQFLRNPNRFLIRGWLRLRLFIQMTLTSLFGPTQIDSGVNTSNVPISFGSVSIPIKTDENLIGVFSESPQEKQPDPKDHLIVTQDQNLPFESIEELDKFMDRIENKETTEVENQEFLVKLAKSLEQGRRNLNEYKPSLMERGGQYISDLYAGTFNDLIPRVPREDRPQSESVFPINFWQALLIALVGTLLLVWLYEIVAPFFHIPQGMSDEAIILMVWLPWRRDPTNQTFMDRFLPKKRTEFSSRHDLESAFRNQMANSTDKKGLLAIYADIF